jgi:LPS export ABC transporter protein LptC
MRRNLHLYVAIISLIFLGYAFYRYFPKLTKEEQNKIKKTEEKFIVLKGTILEGWHNGKKQWILEAEKITVSRDKRYTYFHNIKRGEFYLNNKKEITIKAKEATYDKLANKLEIKGNIVLKKEDFELRTKELVWDGKKELLMSKSSVKILLAKGSILKANFLKASVDLQTVFLWGDLEGKFKVEKKEVKIPIL